MKKILVIGVFCFINSIVLLAEQKNCYIAVENSGSYDQLTVTTISLTMLRQFVDPKVQPTPISGFSDKECIYRINVTEQETGIKVFIIGENISDYGKSQLRGEPGLEQALLRGILKSLNEQTSTICNKYGSVLEDECQGKTLDVILQKQDKHDPRIPPDCQKKQGVRLPDKCRMFYERDNQLQKGENQHKEPIPPDCHKKQGVRLPDHCMRFYESGENKPAQ